MLNLFWPFAEPTSILRALFDFFLSNISSKSLAAEHSFLCNTDCRTSFGKSWWKGLGGPSQCPPPRVYRESPWLLGSGWLGQAWVGILASPHHQLYVLKQIPWFLEPQFLSQVKCLLLPHRARRGWVEPEMTQGTRVPVRTPQTRVLCCLKESIPCLLSCHCH